MKLLIPLLLKNHNRDFLARRRKTGSFTMPVAYFHSEILEEIGFQADILHSYQKKQYLQ